MAGRPDFSQAGSQGSGQTLAVSNRPELQVIEASKTTTVNSDGSERVEIYAPTGSIYSVVECWIKIVSPSGASTGSHFLNIRGAGAISSISGQSSHDININFLAGEFKSANESEIPTEPVNQHRQMTGLKATENRPIQINYINNTDAAHSSERIIKFVVEEDSY